MKRLLATAAVVVAISAAGFLYAGAQVTGPVAPEGTVLAAPALPAGTSQTIQAVTLKVDGMWCASCSYIVRQALLGTPGVVFAEVSGRMGTAEVMYDPAITSAADLIAATQQYGYPSAVISEGLPPIARKAPG